MYIAVCLSKVLQGPWNERTWQSHFYHQRLVSCIYIFDIRVVQLFVMIICSYSYSHSYHLLLLWLHSLFADPKFCSPQVAGERELVAWERIKERQGPISCSASEYLQWMVLVTPASRVTSCQKPRVCFTWNHYCFTQHNIQNPDAGS